MSNVLDIAPFSWIDGENSVSVIMTEVGSFQQDIFDSRAEEGFEGGGYDWQSLAVVFLAEKMSHLAEKINFDSESSMFCAYTRKEDAPALQEFVIAFKKALDDKPLILDIFSRAELD